MAIAAHNSNAGSIARTSLPCRQPVAFTDRIPHQITKWTERGCDAPGEAEELPGVYKRPCAVFDDRVGTRGDGLPRDQVPADLRIRNVDTRLVVARDSCGRQASR